LLFRCDKLLFLAFRTRIFGSKKYRVVGMGFSFPANNDTDEWTALERPIYITDWTLEDALSGQV
jgi:hypothetical protein